MAPPPERLAQVVDELYGADVSSFTAARNRFAAQARRDGDKELVAQIAALGKPTRSAHAVNLLVRSDDAVGDDLTELGDELREAEQSRDAPRMRELAVRRRHLVDGLVTHAFEIIGQDDPPLALREEVAATLNAALADADVARQILAGALVRPVRWEGFGSVPLSRISALPEMPATTRRKQARKAEGDPEHPDERAAPGAKPGTESKTAAESRQAAEKSAALEAERRRQDALGEARQAADHADAHLGQTADQVAEFEAEIRDLESRVSEAQRRLERARIELRRARSAQREAQRQLEKLED